MQHGLDTLKKYNYDVDFVVTHSPTASIIALLGEGLYEQDRLTKYLEGIKRKLKFKKWFSGHMHVNRQIFDNYLLLYEQIIRVH